MPGSWKVTFPTFLKLLQSYKSYFPKLPKSQQKLAGKLAGCWIKLDLKVNVKLALKVDQQLTKGSLKGWPKVNPSCTQVNKRLIKVGFGSWSKAGSKSWPRVNQSYLTKLINSWSKAVQKSINR